MGTKWQTLLKVENLSNPKRGLFRVTMIYPFSEITWNLQHWNTKINFSLDIQLLSALMTKHTGRSILKTKDNFKLQPLLNQVRIPFHIQKPPWGVLQSDIMAGFNEPQFNIYWLSLKNKKNQTTKLEMKMKDVITSTQCGKPKKKLLSLEKKKRNSWK